MTTLESIKIFWPFIVALVAIVVWAIRLEGKITNTEKDVTLNTANIHALEKTTDTFREDIKVAIATINTNIQYMQKDTSETKHLLEKLNEKINK
ncbi:MAG: hypothetical protein M3P98_01415 [bacterium]|nr:hypothetical protein [bacterium]